MGTITLVLQAKIRLEFISDNLAGGFFFSDYPGLFSLLSSLLCFLIWQNGSRCRLLSL